LNILHRWKSSLTVNNRLALLLKRIDDEFQ